MELGCHEQQGARFEMRSKSTQGLNHGGPWVLVNIQWQTIGGLEAHGENDLNILKDYFFKQVGCFQSCINLSGTS